MKKLSRNALFFFVAGFLYLSTTNATAFDAKDCIGTWTGAGLNVVVKAGGMAVQNGKTNLKWKIAGNKVVFTDSSNNNYQWDMGTGKNGALTLTNAGRVLIKPVTSADIPGTWAGAGLNIVVTPNGKAVQNRNTNLSWKIAGDKVVFIDAGKTEYQWSIARNAQGALTLSNAGRVLIKK